MMMKMSGLQTGLQSDYIPYLDTKDKKKVKQTRVCRGFNTGKSAYDNKETSISVVNLHAPEFVGNKTLWRKQQSATGKQVKQTVDKHFTANNTSLPTSAKQVMVLYVKEGAEQPESINGHDRVLHPLKIMSAEDESVEAERKGSASALSRWIEKLLWRAINVAIDQQKNCKNHDKNPNDADNGRGENIILMNVDGQDDTPERGEEDDGGMKTGEEDYIQPREETFEDVTEMKVEDRSRQLQTEYEEVETEEEGLTLEGIGPSDDVKDPLGQDETASKPISDVENQFVGSISEKTKAGSTEEETSKESPALQAMSAADDFRRGLSETDLSRDEKIGVRSSRSLEFSELKPGYELPEQNSQTRGNSGVMQVEETGLETKNATDTPLPDYDVKSFVDSLIETAVEIILRRTVEAYVSDIVEEAQRFVQDKLIADEEERMRPDICQLREFKRVGLTKEDIKQRILNGLYFPSDPKKRIYYGHDPKKTLQVCYDYLIKHRYSKIDPFTLRMVYRISLAGLSTMTELCINFGYLADGTGETLLSIGAIREGNLVDLKLLCTKQETPSFNVDAFTSRMNHNVPDLAWRKAKLLCPKLSVHLVMLCVHRYTVASRFVTKNMPLESVHISTGYRGVRAGNFAIWYFDYTLKMLTYFPYTLHSLSFYVWHSRERLDNLIKRLLEQLYNLHTFEYFGTLQYLQTVDEICLYYLQRNTAMKRLTLFKIEDPCQATELRKEMAKRRDKYAPLFKSKDVLFSMGTFCL